MLLSQSSVGALGGEAASSMVLFCIDHLNLRSEVSQTEDSRFLDNELFEKLSSVFCAGTFSIQTDINRLEVLFKKTVSLEGVPTTESQIKIESSRTYLKSSAALDTEDQPSTAIEIPLLNATRITLVHEELKDSISCDKLICEPRLIAIIAPSVYKNLRAKTFPVGGQLLLPNPETLYADLVLKYNLCFEQFEILDYSAGVRFALTEFKQDNKTGKTQSKSRFELKQFRILKQKPNSNEEIELARSALGKHPQPGFLVPKQNVAKTASASTETKWHSKVSFKIVVENSEFKKSNLSRLNSGGITASNWAPNNSVFDKTVYQSTLNSAGQFPTEMEDMSTVKYVLNLAYLYVDAKSDPTQSTRTLSGLKQINELLMRFSSIVEFSIAKLVSLSNLPVDVNRKNTNKSNLTSSTVTELLIAESPKEMDDSDDSDDFEDISDKKASTQENPSNHANTQAEVWDYLIETFLNCSIVTETIGNKQRAVWRCKSYFSMILPQVANRNFFAAFQSRVLRCQSVTASYEAEQAFHDHDLVKNPLMIQIDADQYMTAYSCILNSQEDCMQMVESYLMFSGLIIKMDNSNPRLDMLSILDSFSLEQLGISEVHLQNCYFDYFDAANDTQLKDFDNTKDQDSIFSRKLLFVDKCVEYVSSSESFTAEVSTSLPDTHPALLGPTKSLESLSLSDKSPQEPGSSSLRNNYSADNLPCRTLSISNAKLHLLLWNYNKYKFKWPFPKMNLMTATSQKPTHLDGTFEPFKFGFSEVISLSGVKCFSKFLDPNKTVVSSRILLISQASMSGTLGTLQAGVEFLFPNQPLLTWDGQTAGKEARLFEACQSEWQPELFKEFLRRKAEFDKDQDFMTLRTSIFEDHYMHLDKSYGKSKVCFSSMKVRLILGEDFVGNGDIQLSSHINNLIEEALTCKPQVNDITNGSRYVQGGAGASNLPGVKPQKDEALEFDRGVMIPALKMFENRRSESFIEFTTGKLQIEEIRFISCRGRDAMSIKATSHELDNLKLYLKHGLTSNLQPFLETDQLLVKTAKGGLKFIRSAPGLDELLLEEPKLALDVKCGGVEYVSGANTELADFLQKVLVPSKEQDPHLCLVIMMQLLFGSPSVYSTHQETPEMKVQLSLEPFCIKLNNEAGGSNKTTISVAVPELLKAEHTVKESIFDIYKNLLSTAISANNKHLGIETKFKDYPWLLNNMQIVRKGVSRIQKSIEGNDGASKSMLGRLKGLFSG